MGALCTWCLSPGSERPGLRWPLAPPVGTLRPVMASPRCPGLPVFPSGLHAGRPYFQPLVPAIKGRAERSPPGQASRSPEAAWALAAILREASAACKMAAWA